MRIAGCAALVTGGAGFIGSHLVRALLDAGAREVVVLDDLSLGSERNLGDVEGDASVTLVVGDCGDLDLLRGLRQGDARFDVCFNLAVIPLPASLERPRSTVDANVAMTTSVCEFGREGGYGRLVQFSSSEVYGTALTVPMSEEHPLNPITPYAASKVATDFTAVSYMRTFALPVTLVRPFNTYGPRQNDKAYAGLIPAVLGQTLTGKTVTIHGDGLQTRDYTYVTDVVTATVELAQCDNALGQIVNLGSGREWTVNTIVAELLSDLDKPDSPVIHGPARPGDVLRLLADVTRARELIGYEPKVGLADGLRETVAWYRAEAGAQQARAG
jgi:UDP-glucose 4-epimerase